jgi:hypothetical protein
MAAFAVTTEVDSGSLSEYRKTDYAATGIDPVHLVIVMPGADHCVQVWVVVFQ